MNQITKTLSLHDTESHFEENINKKDELLQKL